MVSARRPGAPGGRCHLSEARGRNGASAPRFAQGDSSAQPDSSLVLGLPACGRSRAACRAPATPTATADSTSRDSLRPTTALPAVPPVRGPLRSGSCIRRLTASWRPRTRAFSSARPAPATRGSGSTATRCASGPTAPGSPGSRCRPTASCGSASSPTPLPTPPALDYPCAARGWKPPPAAALWLDSASLAPHGRVWWPAGEYLTLSVRASEGASVRLRLPDGATVPLRPEPRLEEVPEGIRAFDRDTAKLAAESAATATSACCAAAVSVPVPGRCCRRPARRPRRRPGLVAAPGFSSSCPGFRIRSRGEWWRRSVARDTVRARWPLQVTLLDTLPVVAELDDDSDGAGGTDRITVGRAVPGGTYHWFFPAGTRARVSGRMNDDLRLRLAPESEAWVAAAEARAGARCDRGARGRRDRCASRRCATGCGSACRSAIACRSG